MAQDYYKDNDIRKMLRIIREHANLNENVSNQNGIPIPKDERFGETVKALEQCVTNQLQNIQVQFENQSLYFYPNGDDIIMTFSIPDMNNMVVNFKLKDSNGQGCYISCENTQLNDDNSKRIQQIKYAFDTWKQSLIQDSSIIQNIKSALTNN